MIAFLLISIFIASALSLVSYIYCWQDICAGRPHIISLRQITNIMDRDCLNRLFGPPERGYFYPLSPEHRQSIIRARRWFYTGECAADILCLSGAWYYMTNAAADGMAYGFIALAMLCQGINLAYSAWLIGQWRHQIREEIENSED